ncbi:MAG: hypothetical protein IJK84_02050, partial [Bacteroidales bacterium]|nr:hypothetical protein [Bacteroidales bacterium]
TGAHLLPDAHQMVHITWVHLLRVFFVHYQNVDEPFFRMSPTHFSEEPLFLCFFRHNSWCVVEEEGVFVLALFHSRSRSRFRFERER